MIQRNLVIKGILFFLLFAFALGAFMGDVRNPDFWWHLATGKWIVENGRLPDEDPFSFTTLQKDPYTPVDRVRFILTQYWLAQAIMYKVFALWGFAGISIFRALIVTLTVAVIGLVLRRHKIHSILILVLLFPAIFVFMGYTGERPQIFSFLFAAILLYLLERCRSSEPGPPEADRSLEPQTSRYPLPTYRYTFVAIPFLMALWANLHGGYIYGIVIILIYISSGWLNIFIARLKGKRELSIELRTPNSRPGESPEATEPKTHILFTVVGTVAIAATFINPNSYHGIIDHFRYQPSISYSYISEWMPTYKIYEQMTIYFGMLIVLTIAIAADIIRRKRADSTHILLFIFNGALSLSAVRFVPFFVITGSFLLGIYLNPFFAGKTFEKKKWLEGASLTVIFLAVMGSAFVSKKVSLERLYRTGVSYGYRTGASYERYPYGAVNFLRQLPPKRIFNHYSWGGYLIWTLYPESKVFIDSRALNQDIFIQYVEVITAGASGWISGYPKWKGILDGYRIDYILLSPKDILIIFELVNSQDWRLIYADNAALLFIRSGEEFRDVIRTYNLPPEAAYEAMLVHGLAESFLEGSKGDKIRTYRVISDIFLKMNRKEEARAYIRKGLELDPQNPGLKLLEKAAGAQQ